MYNNGVSMKAEWLIAKYVPDLRRREPTNIGVILRMGDLFLSRFLGQRDDNRLDGRSLRWVDSQANYRAWVGYWRHATRDEHQDLDTLTKRIGDENYFLEYGGERLFGSESADPNDMLDYLYSILVEAMPEPQILNVHQLSENVLRRVGIAEQVTRRYRLEIPQPSGTTDHVFFDYKYDNGTAHLMDRISLTYEDERSWDSVHAATWGFEKAASQAGSTDHLVALLKTREPDSELESQIDLIGEYAAVVEVSQVQEAASELAELLHLNDDAALR